MATVTLEKFLKSLQDELKDVVIEDSELEKMIEDAKTESIRR